MARTIKNRGLARLFSRAGIQMKEADLNRSSVFHWAHGRNSPNLEKRIASTLKVSVSRLRREVGLSDSAVR